MSDVDLTAIGNGTAFGFRIIGAYAGDNSGYSVSDAGDFNNDGYADLIIGAPLADSNSKSGSGAAYIIFGSANPISVDLRTMVSGVNTGIRIQGAAVDDNCGWSVSSAGDVNGDGRQDVVIGAPLADPGSRTSAGTVYVLFGHDTNTAFVDLDMATMSSGLSVGFRIHGWTAGDQLGSAVCGAGDFNKDSFGDVLMGAIGGGSGRGVSYIIYGHSNTNDFADFTISVVTSSGNSLGFSMVGISTGEKNGFAVSPAGDINGDGYADIIIGAPLSDPSVRATASDAGMAFVIYGRATFGAIPLTSLTAAQGFRIFGATAGDNCGYSVGSAGDFNSDGYSDVIVGAPIYAPSSAGASYIIYGHSTATAFPDLDLLSLSSGVRLTSTTASMFSGWSVSGAGDVNGDGGSDIIIGAYGAAVTGRGTPGASYVFHGIASPTSQPSSSPSSQPSRQPSRQPTSQPTRQPTSQPTSQPTRQPSSAPTSRPSSQPSMHPSAQPNAVPTSQPSRQPSSRPTNQPSGRPSSQPSSQPSARPSNQPSVQPSMQPSARPTSVPTSQPSRQPSLRPSCQPSRQPSSLPSSQPSVRPSSQPSVQPSGQPSAQPLSMPTAQPSRQPSSGPSTQPSAQPSAQPFSRPSGQPSTQPSRRPSVQPSTQPSVSPSRQPSSQPSSRPSVRPSGQPSTRPSRQPSTQPTKQPSGQPSISPTYQPSSQPTDQPSARPSSQPSEEPSAQPSDVPSSQPSAEPTIQPSAEPSAQPSGQPSQIPSMQPSAQPSVQPLSAPTSQPTTRPSVQPSMQPSAQPSAQPRGEPSSQPSGQPLAHPSSQPSSRPSAVPSAQPSSRPTRQPSAQPSRQPSSQPSAQPTRQPSTQPSRQPSGQPSTQPSAAPTIYIGEWSSVVTSGVAVDTVSTLQSSVWGCGRDNATIPHTACTVADARTGEIQALYKFPWNKIIWAGDVPATSKIMLSGQIFHQSGNVSSEVADCEVLYGQVTCMVKSFRGLDWRDATYNDKTNRVVLVGRYGTYASISLFDLKNGSVSSYVYRPSTTSPTPAVASAVLLQTQSVPGFFGSVVSGTCVSSALSPRQPSILSGWVRADTGVMSMMYLYPSTGTVRNTSTDMLVTALAVEPTSFDSFIVGGLELDDGMGVHGYMVRTSALYKKVVYGVKYVPHINISPSGTRRALSTGRRGVRGVVRGVEVWGNSVFCVVDSTVGERTDLTVLRSDMTTGAITKQANVASTTPNTSLQCTDITTAGMFLSIACTVQSPLLQSQSLLVTVDTELTFRKLPSGFVRHSNVTYSKESMTFKLTPITATTRVTTVSNENYAFGGSSVAPSRAPSRQPTVPPVTRAPSRAPSPRPSSVPSGQPSSSPTAAPSVSARPTSQPSTSGPTNSPKPTYASTERPTARPSSSPPSAAPSVLITVEPTATPTIKPSVVASALPTSPPSVSDTPVPTAAITPSRTASPSTEPSSQPTSMPSQPEIRDGASSSGVDRTTSTTTVAWSASVSGAVLILGVVLYLMYRRRRTVVHVGDARSPKRAQVHADFDNTYPTAIADPYGSDITEPTLPRVSSMHSSNNSILLRTMHRNSTKAVLIVVATGSHGTQTEEEHSAETAPNHTSERVVSNYSTEPTERDFSGDSPIVVVPAEVKSDSDYFNNNCDYNEATEQGQDPDNKIHFSPAIQSRLQPQIFSKHSTISGATARSISIDEFTSQVESNMLKTPSPPLLLLSHLQPSTNNESDNYDSASSIDNDSNNDNESDSESAESVGADHSQPLSGAARSRGSPKKVRKPRSRRRAAGPPRYDPATGRRTNAARTSAVRKVGPGTKQTEKRKKKISAKSEKKVTPSPLESRPAAPTTPAVRAVASSTRHASNTAQHKRVQPRSVSRLDNIVQRWGLSDATGAVAENAHL